MTKIDVRMATPGDAGELARFNCLIARETEDRQLDPDVVTPGVQALFEHPERGFYVVAEADGRVAGALMITSEWSDWRNGMFWWIQSVYVSPEHRRRGVYRSLYRFVEAMAREDPDVCGFRLYVDRDNHRAQQTYRSLGMEATDYLVFEAASR